MRGRCVWATHQSEWRKGSLCLSDKPAGAAPAAESVIALAPVQLNHLSGGGVCTQKKQTLNYSSTSYEAILF